MNTAMVIQSDVDSRAQMYQLLVQLFRFPDKSLHEQLASGSWQTRLKNAAGGIDFDLSLSSLSQGEEGNGIASDSFNLNAEDYEIEFIALYEVGMGGAPCPLHSGHYGRDRMKTMEEVLRFYRFFDYFPDRSADRFPDHLTFELEFMARLAELSYAVRIQDDQQAEKEDVLSSLRSFTLAQRDFVMRNLVSWVPDLVALIDERSQHNFFKQTGNLLGEFVQQDYEFLERQLEEF